MERVDAWKIARTIAKATLTAGAMSTSQAIIAEAAGSGSLDNSKCYVEVRYIRQGQETLHSPLLQQISCDGAAQINVDPTKNPEISYSSHDSDETVAKEILLLNPQLFNLIP